MEKLRICHYNILDGGRERLNHISNVIKKINPDVCGILEAVGSKKELKNLEKIANNLGYSLFKVAIANSKYNIAVFSKIPLIVKSIKKGFQHVVLNAILKKRPFKDVNIYFIHLSPTSEDNRLSEIKNLSKYISKLSKVIIMGDLNSLSPNDPYNRKNLLKEFQKNNIKKYGVKKLRFNVIKKTESLKMKDAADYLKYPFTFSTPTLSNKDKNHVVGIRIDYAFLTKNLLKYLHKIEIVKNDTTNKASDHYPLFIDIKK